MIKPKGKIMTKENFDYLAEITSRDNIQERADFLTTMFVENYFIIHNEMPSQNRIERVRKILMDAESNKMDDNMQIRRILETQRSHVLDEKQKDV